MAAAAATAATMFGSTARRWGWRASVAALSLAVSASCSKRGAPSGSAAAERDAIDAAEPATRVEHHDEPAHGVLPKRVRLDPQVVSDAKIRTAPARREVLAATLELPGEISSDPDKTARVSALVGGRLESVSFQEGKQVKKGDILAVIKVPELGKIRSSFASASAKAKAARSAADRLRNLRNEGLSGEQEVLNAEAEAEALRADAHAVGEQLAAMGMAVAGTGALLRLSAPMSGVVIHREAIVGQPVMADQVIATIADLAEVWFLGRVFEKDLGQIQVGAAAEVRLNAYPNEKFSGSVGYLSKAIDPVARTVVARVRIENRAELLRLGLFGIAQVATGSDDGQRPARIVVPRDAVTEIGNQASVFVRQPDGDFDLHEVVLGEGALGKIEVLSGLREGEQVVVDGVFTLKSAVLRSTFGEEE